MRAVAMLVVLCFSCGELPEQQLDGGADLGVQQDAQCPVHDPTWCLGALRCTYDGSCMTCDCAVSGSRARVSGCWREQSEGPSIPCGVWTWTGSDGVTCEADHGC